MGYTITFLLEQGYRVVAHDRRGHGRSSQVWDGHDMDHYADDVAEVVKHLNIKNAIHIGHSTGGGEVVRYIARHGQENVAKAVLVSAVPPLMVQTENNPEGLPKEVLMTFKIKYSQTVRNFSVTCHLVHSMVLTALMRNHLKVSFRTGGVRV